jgi:hypothetical protein
MNTTNKTTANRTAAEITPMMMYICIGLSATGSATGIVALAGAEMGTDGAETVTGAASGALVGTCAWPGMAVHIQKRSCIRH